MTYLTTNMKEYWVRLQRMQRGEMLDWTQTTIIETRHPPKIGEGRQLLVDPPIHETIAEIYEMIEITLQTADNQLVAHTIMPKFESMPQVVIWGNRVFKQDSVMPIIYNEIFAYTIVPL